MATKLTADENSTDEMAIDADETTKKRARWGAFAFVLAGGGGSVVKVNVANHSHGEDEVADHTYTVTVDAGGPIECTCPAFEYHCEPGEACKHMFAVADTEAVRRAALASIGEDPDGDDEPAIATDGGEVLEDEGEDDDEDDVDESPGYTRHVEAPAQGGAAYWRCEGCGYEILVSIGRDQLVHAEGCPEDAGE